MFDRVEFANTCPQRANVIEWLPFGEGESVVVPNTVKQPVMDMLKSKHVQLQPMSPSHIEKLALNPGTGNLDYIIVLDMEVNSTIVAGLMRKLKPGGRLVLQLHNRYGMSYFAGKPASDGDYYAAIEAKDDAKTAFYSFKGLENLLKSAGIEQYNRYYLDPNSDYAVHIFSDKYLPKAGDVVNNLCNLTYDRIQMFDEAAALEGAAKDEMYPVFANDYLIVTGETLPQVMVRYSNDRAGAYQIKTEMYETEDGLQVSKTALSSDGESHIRNMEQSFHTLCEQYEGIFTIAPCEYRDGKVVFPFVKGVSLANKMQEALANSDTEQVFDLFHTFLNKLRQGKKLDFSNYDFVFSNLLIDGDMWNVIDYEWSVSEYVPAEELAFRAAYCFSLEHPDFPLGDICQILEFDEREVQRLMHKERMYQSEVTDGQASLATVCAEHGGDVFTKETMLRALELATTDQKMQIYLDSGKGFTEEHSYFVEHAMTGHSEAYLTLKVPVGMKALRIDPCEEPCIIQIKKLWWNGLEKFLDHSITANELKGKANKNGYAEMIFATRDPNFTISLEKLENADGSQNELNIEFEIHKVSLQLANMLQKSVKRIF